MIFKLLPNLKIAWSDVWVGAALTSLLFTAGKFVSGFISGRMCRLLLTEPPALWWSSSHGSITRRSSCILALNSRGSTRARSVRKQWGGPDKSWGLSSDGARQQGINHPIHIVIVAGRGEFSNFLGDVAVIRVNLNNISQKSEVVKSFRLQGICGLCTL
jgi:hypothetical protein